MPETPDQYTLADLAEPFEYEDKPDLKGLDLKALLPTRDWESTMSIAGEMAAEEYFNILSGHQGIRLPDNFELPTVLLGGSQYNCRIKLCGMDGILDPEAKIKDKILTFQIRPNTAQTPTYEITFVQTQEGVWEIVKFNQNKIYIPPSPELVAMMLQGVESFVQNFATKTSAPQILITAEDQLDWLAAFLNRGFEGLKSKDRENILRIIAGSADIHLGNVEDRNYVLMDPDDTPITIKVMKTFDPKAPVAVGAQVDHARRAVAKVALAA